MSKLLVSCVLISSFFVLSGVTKNGDDEKVVSRDSLGLALLPSGRAVASSNDDEVASLERVERNHPRVLGRKCNRVSEVITTCNNAEDFLNPLPEYSSLTDLVKEMISEKTKEVPELPIAIEEEGGVEECKKCLSKSREEVNPISDADAARVVKKLEEKALEMMETSILDRLEVLLEDEYILNADTENCGYKDWISDKTSLGQEGVEVLPASKVRQMNDRMKEPGRVEVFRCSDQNGKSGKILTLEDYRSKAVHVDPSKRDNASSLVQAMSYISKRSAKRLAKIFGEQGGVDKNITAIDFLKMISQSKNYKKLQIALDNNKMGHGYPELRLFLKELDVLVDVDNPYTLADKVSRGLEEEPALRYVLSHPLNEFQNNFTGINRWKKARLANTRKEIKKDLYKYLRDYASDDISKKNKMSKMVGESQSVYCENLKRDFKNLKVLKDLLSKSEGRLFEYVEGSFIFNSKVEANRKDCKVGSDDLVGCKELGPSKLFDNTGSILSAVLDNYTDEKKVTESNNEALYYSLAFSKCNSNSDYRKRHSSSFPLATSADSFSDKPVKPNSKDELISDNRFTHWAKGYCEDPEKAEAVAASYHDHMNNWSSLNCSMRSCHIVPTDWNSEQVASSDSGLSESENHTNSFTSNLNRSPLQGEDENNYRIFREISRARNRDEPEKFVQERRVNKNQQLSRKSTVSSSRDKDTESLFQKRLTSLENENRRLSQNISDFKQQKTFDNSQHGLSRNIQRSPSTYTGERRANSRSHDSYMNKDSLELGRLVASKLSEIEDQETLNGLESLVSGNLDMLAIGQITLAIDANISDIMTPQALINEISDIDKAKIKELIKSGQTINIKNKDGVIVWSAKTGSQKYLKLVAAINLESDNDVKIGNIGDFDEERSKSLLYNEFLDAAMEVSSSN